MKSKRFLLALIAASMSLAGCGKKDKDDTPAEDTPTVDPGDDPSGGDPSGGDEDELTPEQRANAGQIQNTIKMVLGITGRYEEEDVTAIDEYTTSYSEEIAAEDVSYNAAVMAIAAATQLETDDPKAIVDFAAGLEEAGTLDDVTYIAVALGKAFLRAEVIVNEQFAEVFAYAADYLDEEGVELHKNVYGLLAPTVTCAAMLMSDGLAQAAGSVYNEEENQLSFEGISGVMSTVGGALTAFSASYESASYLANLVVDGVEGFVEKFFPEDEELEEQTRALKEAEEEFGVQDIIDGLYQTVAVAGFGLQMLAMDDSPAEHVVDLVNLALAKNYMALALALFGDFNQLIGIEDSEWKSSIGSLVGVFFTAYSTVQGVVETLSGSFVDEETGKVSADLLKAAVVACSEKIQLLGAMGDLALDFDAYLVKVVNNVLVVFGGYEKEAAAEVAAQFDVSEQIKEVYEGIAAIGGAIGGLENSVFEIVAHFMNEEFSEGFEELLTYLGYEGSFEDAKADFEAIQSNIMGIVAYFADDAFMEKVVGLYDGEEIDLTAAKALIVEIAEKLAEFIETKENVLNLSEVVVDALKLAFVKCGMSQEEADALFAEFDVEEFVNMIYGYVQMAIGFIDSIGSTEQFDPYLEAIKSLAEVFMKEDASDLEKGFVVYDFVVTIFYEALHIESVTKGELKGNLLAPVLVVVMIGRYFGTEEFSALLAGVISVDGTIDVDGVKALLADLANNVVLPISSVAKIYVDMVDVLREVVEKVNGEYDPEAEEGEPYVSMKAALEAISETLKTVAAFLKNEDDALEPYLPMIEHYGNLILEGYAIYEQSQGEGFESGYVVMEYLCRVISEFVPAETEDIEISTPDDIEGKVAEAIGFENIQERIAAGDDVSAFTGSGVAFDLLEGEEEGEYYVEVTLVSSFDIEVTEGAISSVSVVGQVYTFKLPSLDFLSELFGGAEAVEVVPELG